MNALFNENTALRTLSGYFSVLENVGYVKHKTVSKFVMYLFLLDFVDYAFNYLTEDDYELIIRAMKRLFTNGGCLLPYPLFCTNRLTVGKDEYMGRLRVRITQNNIDRVTEDSEYYRIA